MLEFIVVGFADFANDAADLCNEKLRVISMKKIILFLFYLILVLSLNACVPDKESEESSMEESLSSSVSRSSSTPSVSPPPESSSVPSYSSGETVNDKRTTNLNDEPKEPTNPNGTDTHDSSIPVPDPNAPLGSPENPIAAEMTDPDLKQSEYDRIIAFLQNRFADYPVENLDIRVGVRYTRITVDVEGADQTIANDILDALRIEFGSDRINNGTYLDEILVISGDVEAFIVID